MSPRPRFLKLAREKQRTILEAAAEEFAARGFDGASFNKIIDRAGISKGAAYYYFDDKEDLYATVFERTMEQLLDATGDRAFWEELESMQSVDADAFWAALADQGVRSIRQMRPHPYLIAFFRHLLAFTEAHGSSTTVTRMMSFARERTGRFLDRGREMGLVRSDIPRDLLIESTFGLGLTLDRWIFARIDEMDDDEIAVMVDQIVALFRGMLSPPRLTPEES
jgi:AcrR family transcriptional regulator